MFWQPILYLDNEFSFPSSKERAAFWLGVAENIGDLLTYWIFDAQSKQVVARSVVRPFHRNRRVKWDPPFARTQVRTTAQHGGDVKPKGEKISKMLSNSEDKYDAM